MTKTVKDDSDFNPQAFKHLFGKELLRRMSDSISGVYPQFDRKKFTGLLPRLEELEMKPRVRLLREELKELLPSEYPKALRILMESARSGKLESFDLWPYSDFVQTYGVGSPELSLKALKELTPLFSSEFAVRPFLIHHTETTLAFLKRCAEDKDEHIRRWASEGSRPRLPWGERLREFVRDPSPTLPILELLKFDPALYVRKSVANHLNDIAKDHPEIVIETLSRWQTEAGSEHSDKVDWIVRRSLRTLIKDGHSGALRLIGVSTDLRIEFSGLRTQRKSFKLGEKIEIDFKIRSKSSKPQKLVVDYIIHFVKSNQSTSPKVFKLKTFTLDAQGEITITKSHHLKKVTTRTYYPGAHRIEIQINGRILGGLDWSLTLR